MAQDFVVGNAAVLIKPVFKNFNKDVQKTLGRTVPAEASKVGTQAGKAMGEATSKSLAATSKSVSRTAFTAGKNAGTQFVTQTAASIRSGVGRVRTAVTGVAKSAVAPLTSQGAIGGSAFVRGVSRTISAGTSAVSRAAGAVAGVASGVFGRSGTTGGTGFIAGARNAIVAGAGALRTAAATVGASVAGTFRTAGATAGAGFSGGFMASLGPLAGLMAIFGLGSAITTGAGRDISMEMSRARLTGQGVEEADVDRIEESSVSSVQGTTFSRADAMQAAGGAYMSGVDLDRMEDHLTLISDITAQSNLEYSRAGELLNRITGEGKASGDVLQQLTENGLYVFPILAEHLGVTQEEVRKLASEGKISADVFAEAMTGTIGGAAKDMADTTVGAWSNLSFAFSEIGRTIWGAITGNTYDEEGNLVEQGDKLVPLLTRLKDSFNAFNTELKSTISSFQDFADENEWVVPAIQGVATALGGIMIGIPIIHKVIGAFKVLGTIVKGHPLILILSLLAGLFIYLWQTNEDFREGVTNAFNKIKEVVTDVWNNNLKPALSALWVFIRDTLIPGLQNFWQNTVKPIFQWIGETVVAAWNDNIKPALTELWAYISETLIPTLKDFWENTVKPVFTLIAGYVSWAFNTIILPLFKVIVSFIFNTLIPAILGFWKDVVFPAFNGIVEIIGGAVDIALGILRGLRTFITETLPNAFETAVDTIGRVWNGLKRLAAAPINFIIDTVYNDGIREVFNKIADAIPGVDMQLPKADRLDWGQETPPRRGGTGGLLYNRAFAKGGFATPGWALVGEQGPELVNFSRPGRVYTADETQEMLGGQSPDGNIIRSAWNGIKSAAGAVTGWVRGQLRGLAEKIISPARRLLDENVTGDGIFATSIRGVGHHIMDKLVGWAGAEDDKVPEVGPMGDAIRGALDYVNRAGWTVFNAIGDPNMQMQTINQSMQGGHRTGKAIDFLGVSTAKLQQAADFMAANAEALNIKYIAWNRRIFRPGSGWSPLSGGVGNDPAHVWHAHAEFYDSGGVLPPGITTALNATGKPEAILTNEQWRDVSTLAARGADALPDEVWLNVDGERFKAYVETRADSRIAAGKRRAKRA